MFFTKTKNTYSIALYALPILFFLALWVINTHKVDASVLKLFAHTLLQTSLLYGVFSFFKSSSIIRFSIAGFISCAFFIQLSYGSYMSVGAIISALGTSPSEAIDFVLFNLIAISLSTLIFVGLLVLPRPKVKSIPITLSIIGFLYLTTPAIIDSFANGAATQKKVYLNSGKARGYSSWYSTIEYYLIEKAAWRLPPLHIIRALTDSYHILNSTVQLASSWSNVQTSKTTPELIVIGIGESLRADNMSLYGYNRNTTPLLKKLNDEKSLQVFSNSTSAGTNTYGSVPASLTKFVNTSDLSKSVVNLAKDAGYKTYWLSNQAKLSRWDFSVAAIAGQSDYSFFNSNDTAGKEYDIILVNKLKEILQTQKSNQKKMIIINFYGSHMKFSNRYPDEFSIFDSPDKLVDTYDNSVLYTDFIQSEIIKLVKNNNGEYLFFSDHGLGDPNGKMRLSHDLRIPPKVSSLNVPLFIFSNRTLALNNQKNHSLFYFECIFSIWTGITAKELNVDDYCKNSLDKKTITYVDSNMDINTIPPQFN